MTDDPISELARLWHLAAEQGEHVVLPPGVAQQLELRALAYREALAAGERILSPSLVEFLGQ
ncbi:MAG TPA: hypothetical protein VFA94_05050 [Acidimicrobiales bacterium]|nr:hypothetical protein [Acidimicrobiales bacterium]